MFNYTEEQIVDVYKRNNLRPIANCSFHKNPDGSVECCPVFALYIDKTKIKEYKPVDLAGKILGMTQTEINSFTEGFDGYYNDDNDELYTFGANLRKVLL